jgi:transcriptional regulator with XRE-family HTH domain
MASERHPILPLMAAQRTERPFIQELPALLNERRLSLRALARQAGVTDAHLSRLLRGVGYRTKPSANLAHRVALALALPPDYFREYREATVIEQIKNDPQLREELYDRLTTPKQ